MLLRKPSLLRYLIFYYLGKNGAEVVFSGRVMDLVDDDGVEHLDGQRSLLVDLRQKTSGCDHHDIVPAFDNLENNNACYNYQISHRCLCFSTKVRKTVETFEVVSNSLN